MPNRLPVPSEVGRRIRARREQAALTREEFARLADVDVTQLGKYERGETDPKLTTLVRIAGAFGVEPGVLLEGIGRAYLPVGERSNPTVAEYLAIRMRNGATTRRGRDRR